MKIMVGWFSPQQRMGSTTVTDLDLVPFIHYVQNNYSGDAVITSILPISEKEAREWQAQGKSTILKALIR